MSYTERALERLNKLIEKSAEDSDEQIDFIVMKQACEKQVAKKIDYTERNYSNLPVAKCSSCGNTTINDNRLLSSAKYCPDCGKKLDWEVVNED